VVDLDRSACQGAANCVGLAPDVFGYDDDALKAVLLVEAVSGEDADRAREAEAACPALAITLQS
jgi:ferredoxin